MAKTKLIGTIGKLLFKAAYPFGKKKADELFTDGTFGDKIAMGAVQAVDDTVDALSDDEPSNSTQLNKIWVGYLRETVLPAIGSEVEPILSKVASPALEALLVSLSKSIVGSSYLLIDDIKDNPQQLKEYADKYFKSQEFRDVVLGWVTELVNARPIDKGLREFFIVAATGLIDLLQGIDVDSNAARGFSRS